MFSRNQITMVTRVTVLSRSAVSSGPCFTHAGPSFSGMAGAGET